ncbi:hypothetical protein Atai01_42160 [Amycolatopsis taiwanensis]|uniref:Uncharacterized protein n=1 Tax=Amycolatopsis taiwanensis TaxID=342230 RepID=A0A9W6VHN4_9PSEU|nr:hypothetical protein Atai01_42160 [Amycolatopsis taiwanensis]
MRGNPLRAFARFAVSPEKVGRCSRGARQWMSPLPEVLSNPGVRTFSVLTPGRNYRDIFARRNGKVVRFQADRAVVAVEPPQKVAAYFAGSREPERGNDRNQLSWRGAPVVSVVRRRSTAECEVTRRPHSSVCCLVRLVRADPTKGVATP